MSDVSGCKCLRCTCVARKGFHDIMETVIYFWFRQWMRGVVVSAGPQLSNVPKLTTFQTAPNLDEGLWSIVSMFCVVTKNLTAAKAELEDTAR